MTDIVEKIIAALGGALGGGSIVALAVFLIKFFGGERQNLFGKTISDLVTALQNSYDTIRELQKSLGDAEERHKSLIMCMQGEMERNVKQVEKRMHNGDAQHIEHERSQNVEITGQAKTILEDIVKIRQISDNLSGVIREARIQADLHHKETAQLMAQNDKLNACLIKNQHFIAELGYEPIELK